MGKTAQTDQPPRPNQDRPNQDRPNQDRPNQEEVLRTVKLALATSSNYGRGMRQQGSNPYDSQLGRPQNDVWGRGKRPA